MASAGDVLVGCGGVVLHSAGLRVTAARRAVRGWRAARPHSRAEAIKRGAGARAGSVSHQAVYDVWAVGVGAGLVRRIEPAGHPALFERRVGNNHPTVCSAAACGDTVDVDCAVGTASCLIPDDQPQFVVDEAEIRFWGLASCTVDPRGSTPAPTRVRAPRLSPGTDVRDEENQQ